MRKVESKEQLEAFELYYQMGAKRSIRSVSEKIGRTKRTVASWSYNFKWSDRVAQRDLEVAKRAGIMELHKETLAIRTNYRKLMDSLLKGACKDIKEGKIQIESVEDLERIIKLDLLLMEEPTERVDLYRVIMEDNEEEV